jgi:hypothetical protein
LAALAVLRGGRLLAVLRLDGGPEPVAPLPAAGWRAGRFAPPLRAAPLPERPLGALRPLWARAEGFGASGAPLLGAVPS